jgi:hypothetical protein
VSTTAVAVEIGRRPMALTVNVSDTEAVVGCTVELGPP